MTVDDDRLADGFDRWYRIHSDDGVAETLAQFLGEAPLSAALEVGCGTGHWLSTIAERARIAVGMDLSEAILGRARRASASARLVRGHAEALPFCDQSVERVVCINALHHFSSHTAFIEEALRVLAPGGALLTVGLDPHAERDSWWVYDYFPPALEIDRDRFAAVRLIRGEMTKAGFLWAESFEAGRLEQPIAASAVAPGGELDRGLTSQLVLLDEDAWTRGCDRLRADMAAADGDLMLPVDLRLFATIGRVAER